MATESVATQSPFQAFSELDLRDEMHNLLMQTTALVLNTYGGSGEGFRGMNEDAQDSYMFLVFNMVKRVESVWKELEWRRPSSEAKS